MVASLSMASISDKMPGSASVAFMEPFDAEVNMKFRRWLPRLRLLFGLPPGQSNLGIIYYMGQGVAQDYAAWYRRAAEQGDAQAQSNLGVMYYRGEGVAQDYAEAAVWYRRAAERGDAEAQFNLGVMYYRGEGVAQDHAEAAVWYRRAAEAGHANAQFNLGYMYNTGEGVAQDYTEALTWYRRAAEQRHARAQSVSAACTTRARASRRIISWPTCGSISLAQTAPKSCLRFATWLLRGCPRPRSPKPSAYRRSGRQRIGTGQSSTGWVAECLRGHLEVVRVQGWMVRGKGHK